MIVFDLAEIWLPGAERWLTPEPVADNATETNVRPPASPELPAEER